MYFWNMGNFKNPPQTPQAFLLCIFVAKKTQLFYEGSIFPIWNMIPSGAMIELRDGATKVVGLNLPMTKLS